MALPHKPSKLLAPMPRQECRCKLRFRLTRQSIPVGPEWALGTDLPVRIVNTFFVGTSHDAVGCDDGFNTMAPDELVNFGADDSILANVLVL
jgi:hypothetical protein